MKLITVVGSPECAVELASVASTYSNNSVLIIDLDGFNPSLDYLLRVKLKPAHITLYQEAEQESSLDIIIDIISKNLFTREMLYQCLQKKRKNLYVLTGCYNEDNYLSMPIESVQELIKRTNEIFDITILLTNSFLYDGITKLAVETSDVVLLPTQMNILGIRNINNKFAYLIEAGKLSRSNDDDFQGKFKHVLFNYNPKLDLPIKVTRDLCKFRIAGVIPYSTLRQSLINTRTPYIKKMERAVVNQYSKLLNKIGIKARHPKPALFTRFTKNFIRKSSKRGKTNGNN
jgi:hypothetical protein